MTNSFRIVVIGATQSTMRIVKGLVRNNANLVCVFSLDHSVSANVSGFATTEIDSFCRVNRIPFQTFNQVNDSLIVSEIRDQAPDVIFAVGFSQLVGEELLSLSTQATIGFHPTCLPSGRGRAPLAWLTFHGIGGAATFFLMGKGVDDGSIIVQEPFEVNPDDHAGDVEKKIMDAIDRALDRWIPDLVKGEFYAKPQNDSLASYTGVRRPEDGLIDWTEPCQITYSRIRAASFPHPGAYTYAENRKIIILRAKVATGMPWCGIPGRILTKCKDRGVLVQAGDGLLWLMDIEDVEHPKAPVRLRVGQRLGYAAQDEIYILKREIEFLKRTIRLKIDDFQR
jgi:methionyl-tRNA formyltransferase